MFVIQRAALKTGFSRFARDHVGRETVYELPVAMTERDALSAMLYLRPIP